MSDYLRLLRAVQALTNHLKVGSVTFGSPDGEQFFKKRDIAMPEMIADYVTHVLPSKSFHDDGLRFLGGRDFLAENMSSSPAMFIREFGFWTVATLPDGDGFCWDTLTGRLVQVDPGHFFYRKGVARMVGKAGPLTREDVDSVAEIQASSFERFVEWMASGEAE